MRVSRYRGDKNLRDLVDRLYSLGDEGPTRAEATEALVAANRHLPLRSRTLSRSVDDGAFIAVPELTGAFDGRSSAPIPSAAVQVIRARATEILDTIGGDLEREAGRESQEIDTLAALLESEEFKAATRETPGLAKLGKQLGARVSERRERLAVVKERRGRALEDARTQIAELAEAIDVRARDNTPTANG
jgi:hypothetical protein